MLQIHPNARTTPVTRAEIAGSHERTGVLAQRYGVSTETIRKWRKRGAADCLDHAARPHQLPWKATEAERAVVCTLRQVTNFALDDLTFVITHFLPHLNRDSIWRILKAAGLNRRPKPASTQPAKGKGTFKDYDLGFVHIDIKHLPPQPFHPLRGWNLGLLRPSCRPPMANGASAYVDGPPCQLPIAAPPALHSSVGLCIAAGHEHGARGTASGAGTSGSWRAPVAASAIFVI
jgi:transposase